MYGKQTTEKFEQFVDMYNSSDVLLLSNQLQKAQQHQHTCTCRKKNHVVYKFHYLLPPKCERKILEYLEINKNDQFSKKTYTHKPKKYKSLKDLKENEDKLFNFFRIF